ncbi:LLM class F420-dependent oxidoreductase [Mycobacterium gordonae]|uniref:LLM class F420-dependent oxidoreductase n=1 Tax=Mycobacterium TaxID=1763 RepID=UPI000CBED5B5|nr:MULTISPECIES: LLM class F420-dependent oxidoreductase [Mycobacterium]MCQ4361725.1 LLM class F420-dependent oxidoreductase [Mycobacterium gordonae]PJE14565.1 MAG: LLM class F420-dependent oxidoreductase [Mycobacterium sp.]
MTKLEVVLPFWLDRPDREALEIARTVAESGFDALWIGEMATYDAFALATAIGLRASELPLKIGPLAVGVRGPVTLALGVSTVASLTGNRVDLALGASSPAIVTGWHNRVWANHVSVMRETIECLRPMLAGERVTYHGRHVNSQGFRLRNPVPEARIALGVFGPGMISLAAQQADEVVLNLASPARVAQVREAIERVAAGRPAPRLTVWVPVGLDPGSAAHAQLAGQLGVYLSPPGYGEMFSALGFGELVQRARAGSSRRALAAAIPVELLDTVCALGPPTRIGQRLREYRDAGADCVAVVPATAEDAGGRRVLNALSQEMP